MSIKKVYLCFWVVIFWCGGAYADDYVVTALNEVQNMNADFWMTQSELTIENDTPFILVEFTGNCSKRVVNQCNVRRHKDHYDHHPLSRFHHHGPSGQKGHYHSARGEHSAHDRCLFVTRLVCEHQEGRYRLPADQVIYDGEKRWKFIRDGHYLTIARNDRSWLSREWHLRSFVELSVAPNGYQSLTVTIHSPAER